MRTVDSPYRIFPLSLGPEATRPAQASEVMGSKEKVWLVHAKTGRRVMLKFARPGSGEDWSERVAFEIARHIGIPCPRVDLATVDGRPAVLCWDFLGNERHVRPHGVRRRALIHGNELLLQRDPAYPAGGSYRVSQHTMPAVERVLKGVGPWMRGFMLGAAPGDAFDTFVGYLMFDALIGNTDRHHENWGVVADRAGKPRVRLAPSYDHASSLGRELTDEQRARRLGATGRGSVKTYGDRAVSAFWSEKGERRLTTIEALTTAGRLRPQALDLWLGRLSGVELERLGAAVDRVPDARLSISGKRFTRELLRYNHQRLIEVLP